MFNEKELRTIMRRKLGTASDFEILDAAEESLGRSGGGFMSEQLKMYVTVKLVNVPRRYEFFVKVVPRTGNFRKEFAVSSGTYDREQHFYVDLDEALGFNDVGGGKSVIPRHFLARKDALVMENLFDRNFKMVDARGFVDFDHCALVMEYLAYFHAATLVHEEKTKGSYRMNRDAKFILTDLMVPPLEEKNWFPAGFKTMARFIDLMPKYKADRDLRRKVREALPAIYQRTAELVKPSAKIRNVVCHGDLWSNNLLFHYDADGKPDTLRFIDFQWVRYAAPTTDIMMFLHLSTDRKFRRAHEAVLLDMYHHSMSTTLRRHGVEEWLFPKGRFLQSCEEVRLMARTTAATYSSLIFMDPEYSSQFLYDEEDCQRFCHIERYEEARHCFRTDAKYRERVSEIMEDFVDNCVVTFW